MSRYLFDFLTLSRRASSLLFVDVFLLRHDASVLPLSDKQRRRRKKIGGTMEEMRSTLGLGNILRHGGRTCRPNEDRGIAGTSIRGLGRIKGRVRAGPSAQLGSYPCVLADPSSYSQPILGHALTPSDGRGLRSSQDFSPSLKPDCACSGSGHDSFI